MKKLISVLMSALLIFAFAGCGGNEGKSSVSLPIHRFGFPEFVGFEYFFRQFPITIES